MATSKQKDSSYEFEESPLLTNKGMNSTVNPNKMDQARFTEIRDMESEGSPIRIVIYIVIVIIVGVGAAYLVKNIISNNQNSTDNTSVSSSSQSSLGSANFQISKSPIDDSNASNLALKTDYTDSLSTSLGTSTADKTNINLTRLTYNRYATFARFGFILTTPDNKLPKTKITFDSANNKITINFVDLQTIPTDLKLVSTISDLVKDVTYDAPNNSFVLSVNDKFKYRPFIDNSNLFIDIKTLTNLNSDTLIHSSSSTTLQTQSSSSLSSISSTSSSTASSVNNTGSAPAAPHYDNTLSQNKQYVASTVTTNSIADNIYYFDTYGANSYEFSWAQKNAVGDSVIPNTTAYYDTTTTPGKIYLMVEISNLSKEVFTANNVTGRSADEIQKQTGVTTSGSNFNRIDLVSFNNGVAKYKLEVQRQTDFKLWVDKTADTTTGTVSVTVKNN